MPKLFTRLFKSNDPVIIMPYGGYANETSLHAQARVLEDEGIEKHVSNSFKDNIVRSLKSFETDEIKGAKVKVSWQGDSAELISDSEGYIYLNSDHGLELNHKGTLWIPVTFELLKNEEVTHSITSSVMKPAPDAEFGVITDMDETLIHTGLESILRWKVIINTFFKHSHDRLPLENAQQLCLALCGGSTGFKENPIFYLSNSPWNLYEYLTAFLEKFNFPKGTLLLRDIGLFNKKKKSLIERNKFVKISHILETYPKLNFILIGDAVDHDPEIYVKIARKYPERILSIYIRVVKSKKKMRYTEKFIENTTDVEIKLIRSSDEALEDAKKRGYIIN